MLLIRSLLYFLLMVITVFLFGLAIAVLGWVMPISASHAIANAWGRTNLWLLRMICGLDYEIQGAENLPHGPSIVMAKHQSTWETMSLRGIVRKEQAWILKRELMSVPIFGWALARVRSIPIDRGAGRKAVRQVIDLGTERLNSGMTVMIFPEGTRTAPGQRRKYGMGGALLASATGYPVIPIAHNAGVFWRRRGIIKYPGTIQLVVGKPIKTQGKSASVVNKEVEDWIESVQEKLPMSLDADI